MGCFSGKIRLFGNDIIVLDLLFRILELAFSIVALILALGINTGSTGIGGGRKGWVIFVSIFSIVVGPVYEFLGYMASKLSHPKISIVFDVINIILIFIGALLLSIRAHKCGAGHGNSSCGGAIVCAVFLFVLCLFYLVSFAYSFYRIKEKKRSRDIESGVHNIEKSQMQSSNTNPVVIN